jgi:iron complex transport system substrate-binding protein
VRIISLIPSGTDIAVALGLNEFLVGKSHTCDHPAVAGLPVLTQSRVRYDMTPREIDDAVRAATQNGKGNSSLYVTDKKLLRDLQPDVVLTQTICDVCAVNANSAARDLPPNAQLVNLSATGFHGLWDDLRAVARAGSTPDLNTMERAEKLIPDLQARLENVRVLVQEKTQSEKTRPKVLVLEWSDPPFIGGHWVPEIIERAGGIHVLGNAGEASRRASWDEIAAADPDVILLAPCGYNLQETAAQGRALWKYSGFQNLRAVQNGAVWATNATHLFSRCTPQSVRAVEVVAGVLQGDKTSCGTDEARRLAM